MSEQQKDYGFNTRSLHAGQVLDSDTGARALPIHPTTAYVFEDTKHAAELFGLQTLGNIYTRINNPTLSALEERVASLEGGLGALALSSGSSAVALTVLTLAQAGDHVVSSHSLYGGTYTQFDVTLRRLGIEVDFVDFDKPGALEKAIRPNTKLVFGETIGNPRCDILDFDTVSKIAHKAGVPLVIDNTVATPYLCRPFEFGADIVIHSATKFLGGHGIALSGVIVDKGTFDFGSGKFPLISEPSPGYHGMNFWESFKQFAFLFRVRAELLRDLGPALSPFNAFLVLQGIETLSLRMQRHVDNARAVAKWLDNHPLVEWTNYPSDTSTLYGKRAARYLPLGPGSVFSFGIKGGAEAGKRFIDSVELLSHVANIGDVKTLVIHPTSTTHSQLSTEEREAMGVTDNLIRLSIGIEDVKDITADLDQAIRKAQ